jgi:murein DD-endopeptidase MepM/ murein hydrolase activator NlpD
MKHYFRWPTLSQMTVCATLICFESAHAQPTALLEACNSIDDKDKRLACLKELSNLRSPAVPGVDAATKKLKNAFAAVAGAVSSGVSLQNYSALLLEPSKELEIFSQERPAPSQRVLGLYEEALLSYRDAERVWHANIFDSSDGGLFLGRILNPEYTGLQGIVNKYNLPTRKVLLSTHLPADAALQIIWRHARERAQEANDLLERPAVDDGKQSSKSDPRQVVLPPGDPLKFQWPVNGAVLTRFNEVSKGLDIDGTLGDPVAAARGGIVVFSRGGLNGYGNLIIIKHDDTYLTAYAHNHELLVKEGERVEKGQIISKMGATDSDRVKLHFEIRKQGKPVDPMQYLISD